MTQYEGLARAVVKMCRENDEIKTKALSWITASERSFLDDMTRRFDDQTVEWIRLQLLSAYHEGEVSTLTRMAEQRA